MYSVAIYVYNNKHPQIWEICTKTPTLPKHLYWPQEICFLYKIQGASQIVGNQPLLLFWPRFFHACKKKVQNVSKDIPLKLWWRIWANLANSSPSFPSLTFFFSSLSFRGVGQGESPHTALIHKCLPPLWRCVKRGAREDRSIWTSGFYFLWEGERPDCVSGERIGGKHIMQRPPTWGSSMFS